MFNHRGIYRAAVKCQPYRSLLQTHQAQNIPHIQSISSLRKYSTQGYGDDKGDPHAEDPQAQGVSQRSRELEHPGPSQYRKKPSDSQSSNQSGSKGGKSETKEKQSNSGSTKGLDKK
ncbi:hypothetical protein VI817_009702 [Penicillium citrinum]|uniref:Uncharacterized protein n=1 Tax=Penicillium hetheringtonii TaxID=911720 RepID=A0AAD6DH41_9EURO|nr:hypothetical protein N7450_006927 [Penicillium hetheringtonii]KAK5788744.1 hypothetical protein VI817_009702 [Penicillium citrinum]